MPKVQCIDAGNGQGHKLDKYTPLIYKIINLELGARGIQLSQESEVWDDLVQAGQVGLVIASKRFEPERGVKLSTFAYSWIRAKVIRELGFQLKGCGNVDYDLLADVMVPDYVIKSSFDPPIQELLVGLSPQVLQVLRMYFFEGLSLKVVGQTMLRHSSWVWDKKERALIGIRQAITNNLN